MKIKKQILLVALGLSSFPLVGCSNVENPLSANVTNRIVAQIFPGISILRGYDNSVNSISKKLATGLTDDELTDFKDILYTIDETFDNENVLNYKDIISNNDNFKFALEVSFTNPFAKNDSFLIYFNVLEEKTVQESKHGFEEKEVFTTIDGMISSKQDEFNFKAFIEEEFEKNEYEKEVRIEIYNDFGFLIKGEFEQELEEDEKESSLKYKVYDAGKLIKSYSIKFEVENNISLIKLGIDGRFFKIIKQVRQGEEFFFVSYFVNNNETNVIFKKVISTDPQSGQQFVDFILQ